MNLKGLIVSNFKTWYKAREVNTVPHGKEINIAQLNWLKSPGIHSNKEAKLLWSHLTNLKNKTSKDQTV